MTALWQLVMPREKLIHRKKKEFKDRAAGIWTQDLMNTSQMLLPLSHWDQSRGAWHKLHIAPLCGGLSQILIDSLSLNGWTVLGVITLICDQSPQPLP